MNPVGEGSDLSVCAVAVVRREIDFGRSSKLDTLLAHILPIITGAVTQWDVWMHR